MKTFFKFFVCFSIGTILSDLLFFESFTTNQKEDTDKHLTITLSDTLLIGNDSLRTDILRRDYGFYIAKNKLDLDLFLFNNTMCPYTIGYWCYDSNSRGKIIWLSYKCYTEDGTIICKGESSNTIGAEKGESEILNFNVWLTELVRYKGIITIVPSIRIDSKEAPLPSIKVKFGGMFSLPKVLSEKTE